MEKKTRTLYTPPMSFINELRRRNTFRVASAYVVFSWLVIQIVETIFPIYDLSDEIIRNVILILAVGALPIVALSWIFELTPDGIKLQSDMDAQGIPAKTNSKTFDRSIILLLAIAIIYFLFDKFLLDPMRDQEQLVAAREQAEVETMAEMIGQRNRELSQSLPNSIAVMLFDNLSPNPEDEYFADGVHESIVNELARIDDINVIARTSMLRYKNRDLPIRDVATELRVGTMMQGSVRYAGNRVRVSAQLIEPNQNLQIWAAQFDRDLVDIFAIQSEIAESIANELKAELLPAERAILARAPTVSANAYAVFLRAMALVREGFRVAARPQQRLQIQNLLNEALQLDPEFALALAWKARILVASRLYDPVTESQWPQFKRETEASILALANKALDLDPNLAMAHSVLVNLYAHNWQGEQAETAAEAALKLEPNNSEVLVRHATLAIHRSKFKDAINYMRHAVKLDPNNGRVLHELGYALHASGQSQQASEVLRRCLRLNPTEAICSVMLARSEFAQGHHIQALEALRLTESLLPKSAAPGIRGEIAWGYGLLGYPQDASRAYAMVERAAEQRYVDPAVWAWARMGIGDYDEALLLLKQAADNTELTQDSYPAHFIRENSWSDPRLETAEFIEVRERLQL